MPRPVIRPYTGSIEFNGGTTELVKTTPTGLNTGGNALSFVTWVYLKSRRLQIVGDLLASAAVGRRFAIGDSGGAVFFFSDGINALNNMTLSQQQFSLAFRFNDFTRAVWTVDATEASIYANGALVKTQALGVTMNSGTYTKLTLGISGSSSFGFYGWMNDAYFANKKMTLADVQEDYFNAVEPSNMASAWMMNEGAGTNIVDRVGSNNLTASNLAWSTVLPTKARTASGSRLSSGTDGQRALAGTRTLIT